MIANRTVHLEPAIEGGGEFVDFGVEPVAIGIVIRSHGGLFDGPVSGL